LHKYLQDPQLEGFDAVIGNPPYQNITKNKGTGNILWDKFVEKSLNIWLKINVIFYIFILEGGDKLIVK
jgi:type I restriction-modification system DNA methylase subunit